MKCICLTCSLIKEDHELEKCEEETHNIISVIPCSVCKTDCAVVVDSGLGVADDVYCPECVKKIINNIEHLN